MELMIRSIQGAAVDMTLDEATSTMIGLAQQGSTAAHKMGTIYNLVVQRKLAELAGYKSALEYFSKHVKAVSKSTLITYGVVAHNFTETICTQYGVYRLRALLRYMEAADLAPVAEPGPLAIDVPQDDGKVLIKTFAECSVDEVERATRAKNAPPPARVPVPDQARLLFFEDSIFRNFNGVAPVRFTAHNEDGQTYLNLQNVPMSQVARLMKALQEGLEAQPSLAVR